MDDMVFFMALSFGLVFGFTIFVFGVISCIMLYRKRTNNAVYSSPVVVTGQSYQPPGQSAFPVNVQTTHQINNTQNQSMNYPQSTNSYPTQNVQMPMPYPTAPSNELPYPRNDTVNFPQPTTAFNNDTPQNFHNAPNDLPPSYHKIDLSHS